MLVLYSLVLLIMLFFFFQAEDGIRDWSVTGVQTCALPISVVHVVVHVQVIRLVKQCEVEEIGVRTCAGALARAAHVRVAACGVETLSPIVPTAGRGVVNQREGWRNLIGRRPLLIQVHGDSRHVRRPTGVDEQTRIVEWPSRGVD